MRQKEGEFQKPQGMKEQIKDFACKKIFIFLLGLFLK